MKKWIRAGFRSVLEIATSAKKLVKGMYHPKNQRMVVIRFSIFDDLFIYIYTTQKCLSVHAGGCHNRRSALDSVTGWLCHVP